EPAPVIKARFSGNLLESSSIIGQDSHNGSLQEISPPIG
ncbi:MAG: hypothetical protein ACI9LA_000389, partial [Bacteroidia bacterium]